MAEEEETTGEEKKESGPEGESDEPEGSPELRVFMVGLEIEEARVEKAKKRAADLARAEKRDGTGRLTWQEPGLREDDVVSAAGRDEVNLEVCRLALGEKILPTFIFRRIGLSLREIFAGGALFAAPLTLTAAGAEIGYSMGAVPRRLEDALILVAILAGLVFPLLAGELLYKEEPEEQAGQPGPA